MQSPVHAPMHRLKQNSLFKHKNVEILKLETSTDVFKRWLCYLIILRMIKHYSRSITGTTQLKVSKTCSHSFTVKQFGPRSLSLYWICKDQVSAVNYYPSLLKKYKKFMNRIVLDSLIKIDTVVKW
jgi:hypothetical protein